MSIARIHYVKAARQRFERQSTGERTAVTSKRTGEPRKTASGREITRRQTVVLHDKPKPLAKCGKCGDTIEVGQPYIWYQVGFRGWKQVRCTKSSCYPRQSELESSATSSIYAAIESAEDVVANLDVDNASDAESEVSDALSEIESAFNEVIEQYRAADESFGGYGATSSAERADELESDRDSLDTYWSFSGDSEPSACDDHDESGDGRVEGCEACEEKRQEWLDEVRNEANDALSNISVS